MDFPDRTMISHDAAGDETSFHAPWPEPGTGHAVTPDFSPLTDTVHDVAGSPEQTSDVTFDEAFDVLDRQTEQLRTLRGRLEGLCEYSAERDRTMRRLEQELAAARAESEHDRRIAAGLRANLAKQDQLLRSVRESVSELATALDSVGSSWNETQAA
jgi:ABC-type transporter Mla subunit MlaD